MADSSPVPAPPGAGAISWAAVLSAGSDPAEPKTGRLLPPPTTALPGTPEKLAVLCQRQRAGQQLWNQAGDPQWNLHNEMVEGGTIRFCIAAEVERNGAVVNRKTAIERSMREADAREDSLMDEVLADMAARRKPA